jgi:uncharacterized membrane protein YozB (DUF420 family)
VDPDDRRQALSLTVHDLPAVNATLNGTAAVLLSIGWWLIRHGRVQQHKKVMIAAFSVSVAFLVSYLVYHAQVGSVRFTKRGPIRILYFSILLTHTVLAAAIVPLVLMSLSRGLKMQYARHRTVARWTMPLWLYVSVTGVIVYLMLYKF